ncbi:MAG: MFS transporter [Nitrososphaerales archaeon]
MVQNGSVADSSGLPWRTVMTVSMGAFITGASLMFIVLALPAMAVEFESPIFVIVWVLIAYSLMTTAFAVPMGKLGDIFGRRTLFITGFGIFALGSLISYFAPTAEFLLGSRLLQGIGASMTVGLGQALVVQHSAASKRGRSLGIASSGWGIGALAGPVIGGVVLQLGFGWRPLFLIMAVLGVAIALISIATIPRVDPPKREGHYDWKGAGLFALSLTTLLIGLTVGIGRAVGNSLMIPMLITSVGAFTLFLFIELKIENPMFDLRLLKRNLYGAAIGLGFLDTFTSHYLPLILTFYLQGLRGFDPLVTASVLVVGPLAALFDPVGGLIADKVGPSIPITAGLSMKLFGFNLLIQAGSEVTILYLIVIMAFIGLGAALTWTPITTMGLGSIPKRNLGAGAGLVYSSRIVGSMVSQAAAILILAAVIGNLVDIGEIFTRSAEVIASDQAFVFSGISTLYQITIILTIITLILAVITIPKSRRMLARDRAEISEESAQQSS